MDKDGNLLYINETAENESILHVCYGENNHYYVNHTTDEKDAYLTKSEDISEYDENGEFVKYITLFDYTDVDRQPQRENCIKALNYKDGSVRFAYIDYTGKITFYSIDTKTLITEIEGIYEPEGYERPRYISAMDNGNYAVTFNDGQVGVISVDGTFDCYYTSEYTMANQKDAYIPGVICTVGEDVYLVSGAFSDEIYKVEKGKITYIQSILSVVENPSVNDIIDYIYEKDGKLAFNIWSEMYTVGDNNEIISKDTYKLKLPLFTAAYVIAKKSAIYVCIICAILGMIALIGCISHWKVTLLLKQLCMTIPVVVAMVTVLLVYMQGALLASYIQTVTQEMVAINELAARNIDGDEIEQITDFSSVDDGTVQKYCDMLNDFIDYNQGYWNKNFDISIYLTNRKEGIYTRVAKNGFYEMPFIFLTYDEGEDESEDEEFSYSPSGNNFFDYTYSNVTDVFGKDFEEDGTLEGTDTMVMTMSDDIYMTVIADTPIYNSKGEEVAILELSADVTTIEKNMEKTVKKTIAYALMFLPIMCLALALISYINIRHLKRLSDAVSEISEGDFSVRINKLPKDEVGEICVSVNQMAEQLDDYFSTKDKNEKFYYKFVPEKFRELLHKDEFTDLSLGDAESADLTVLFCDIRAFSLNSEMMTAKENFEFVNIIYGKAGPIIRKHNGFIDKYIGDAIMALFENADDAIAAGREVYREIVLNPETARELNVSSINIGIGIHSGMARIGIVGEDERMSGTVISNTVNLSSRLESLTKRYAAAMLISKDTLDRLSDPDSLNTRYLGMIQVAGVNEVKAVYEVLDCLGKDDMNFKDSQKDQFREAIRLYHLGQLDEALEIFKKLKADKEAKNGNDPALDMYIEYIEDNIAAGNTDHKIFRFSRK